MILWFGMMSARAQRIKVTPGITGWSRPIVHIDGAVRHLDVGSSHPGAGVGPKGLAVRQLKRYASWVQNVARQFGLLSTAGVSFRALRGTDICGGSFLVREDRSGRTTGLSVVLPRAVPSSYVRMG